MFENSLTRRSSSSPISRDPFFDFANRFFSSGWPGVISSYEGASQGWTPAVDIRETDNAFIAEAELPGLKKDDINVSIEDNLLTISGERRLERDEKKDNYHRIERSYGSFQRSFSLPRGVDATKVEAKFSDGVLKLSLPKSEVAKVRKIAVS